MISDEVKAQIRKLRVEDKMSFKAIAQKLKLTKGQVSGYCTRENIPTPEKTEVEGKMDVSKINNIKNPTKWLQSYAEAKLDRSKITLINIPSISEHQSQTVYSYIPRDQSSGMRTTDHQSLDE